ncbi:hypothetical protein P9112_010536 [Eukaryota sp. TZLM1-RC]
MFLSTSIVGLFPAVKHQTGKCLLVVDIKLSRVVLFGESHKDSLVHTGRSLLDIAKLSKPIREYSAIGAGDMVISPLLPLIKSGMVRSVM